MINQNKSKKIFLLYSLIAFGFIIFLSVMLINILKQRHIPSLYAKESSKAQRGNIISADGFHVATTKKLYKASLNTKYIDPKKKELFIQLFSIYSGVDTKKVRKALKKKGFVVLSYNIQEKEAQYLKKLSYELRRYKVFIGIPDQTTGIKRVQGLSIVESGESRVYPYKDLLTPIIGYPRKVEKNGYTYIKGVKGLERKFNNELSARVDGSSIGFRDVNGYIILNKDSFTKAKVNGLDIKLTIPVSLQIKMERICSEMKKELDAKEVMIAIMNSKNGKILSMASSNRYLPKSIKRSDYPSLNSGMIEFAYEPGSVIKTITFALLLDKGLINPYDLVNTHNGRFKIGRKVITDEHKYDWLSAENVIVHSSNIGIAQLAQKLSGSEFYNGLKAFGFTTKSTKDLIYEKKGSIPSARKLENEIYKATAAYGYGMNINLMQLVRAYSVFSNNGKMVNPKLIDSFIDEFNRKIPIESGEQIQVIKSSTALRVKKILAKTVREGTGKKTKTEGLYVGGKTGTAQMVEKGQYIKKYNTSFLGFANDKTHSYTIGVMVKEPLVSKFASSTAVPVFKKGIDVMIEEGYLQPNIIE